MDAVLYVGIQYQSQSFPNDVFLPVFDDLYFELGVEPFAVGVGAVAVGVDGGAGGRVCWGVGGV